MHTTAVDVALEVSHDPAGMLLIAIGEPIPGEGVAPMMLEQNPDKPTHADIWTFNAHAPGNAEHVEEIRLTDPMTQAAEAWASHQKN